MTPRPLVRTAVAFLFLIPLTGATFSAQLAQPNHTLVFAELTYGTQINAMVADRAGGAWFAGNTCSTALPTTAGAVKRTNASGCRGILGRMTADGAITYLTYLGGTQGTDSAYALALDAAGNVYVGGSTTSPDFPTTAGAYDRVCGNDGTCTMYRYYGFAARFMTLPASDGFVTELSAAGDRILYSTYVGGSDSDVISALAVDTSGRINVTGNTISTDFPVTAGALQTAWSPDYDPDDDPLTDGFYARIGSGRATLDYGTYLGGTGNDWGTGVAIDAHGDAYVTGTTSATNFPVQNAARPTNTSTLIYPHTSPDAFLARFDSAGAVYSTYVGGSSYDAANGIAVVDDSVFLAGELCSTDFPGVSNPGASQCEAYVAELGAATGAVTQTAELHNRGGFDRANAIAVDDSHIAYVTGLTVTSSTSTPSFPTTADGYQRTSAPGAEDAFFSIVDMAGETPSLVYSTYLGGSNEEQANAVALDGNGGAFFGGYSRVFAGATSSFPSHTTQGQPPAEPSPNQYQSFAAHVAAAASTTGTPGADVVIYANGAFNITGNWQGVQDATAAAGFRLENPDSGAAKIAAASAAPANAFELTFDAQAGVPYHLWVRMKAANDSWTNDSVFVQFSDSVDASGNPVWRTGTTSATVVSLEDCSGCGEQGWGWNDNGYAGAGTPVYFAASGKHTIRVQQREDGVSIDQVVLSSAAYLSTAPGANKNDMTVLPASSTPPAPPPSDLREVVLYGSDLGSSAGPWQLADDASAASGLRLWNPDAGIPKITTAGASPGNFADITFNAQAGVAYHLWLRMKADGDSWTNDSVFVQFSDSVDASGAPVWRIGSTSATVVSLEDCSGCGEQGWGWNDNGYGTPGTMVTFATSGAHTIRIQQREDGVSIDQIVLSAVKYANTAPGAAKNDATVIAR